jgi:AraC-like DNA-binding protein/mannose-6-phosphate isomerase-like protein (cupin superfamily)
VTLNSIDHQLQIQIYYVGRPAYKSLQIHEQTRPFWILSHVVEGEVEMNTLEETYLVKPGDVMLHPPQEAFSEYARGAGQHEVVFFDVRVWPETDLFNLYPISPVVPLAGRPGFSTLFAQLLQVWETDSTFRDLNASGLIVVLLAELLECWAIAGQNSRKSLYVGSKDRFIPAINYMAKNLHQKICREQLAAMVHLNPSYFDRIFAESYGIAPLQMLRKMRLQQARQLLENTDKSLGEIANACGFEDISYFCRIFRHQLDQTPGQYRKDSRNRSKNLYQ